MRQNVPNHPQTLALFEEALDVLRAQGAVLIEGLEIPHRDKYASTELTVLLHEFKTGIGDYLRNFQPDAPAQDLQGLIDWNTAHTDTTMPFFGQELLLLAQKTRGLASAAYQKALAH